MNEHHRTADIFYFSAGNQNSLFARHRALTEEAECAALAAELGLHFTTDIDASLVRDIPFLDTQLKRPLAIRLDHPNAAPSYVIVPAAVRSGYLKALIDQRPELQATLILTTPSALRKAVWAAGEKRRVRETVNFLFDRLPQHSAKIVLWGYQGFWIGTVLTVFIALLIFQTALALLFLHILLSIVYFASLNLRIAALAHRRRPRQCIPLTPTDDELPVYTVFVALYQEAALAGQLVTMLRRLNWPRDKLDIKLICEADDHDTISALENLSLETEFEIVSVPFALPRTKPKALSYVLPAARGEYLAVFDAEDRPHPDQLREAYAQFRAAPANVASLQAPLIITNARASWISAIFSLEYSALFRGVMPMLAARSLPLPLGGTSNHFKTDLLLDAGGWDPFNVTEDADLGMRLYRMGYRSQVLHRQTLEDAPVSFAIWIGQRTRWYKGWLQTWLVLTRSPGRIAREMGLAGYTVFQLMIGGMLLSAITHPLVFIFMIWGGVSMLSAPAEQIAPVTLILFIIDTINIFGSYATIVLLGLKSMTRYERKLVGLRWTAIPLYWLMTSWAAWRAVNELRSKPFFWIKTPHSPTQNP